MFIYATPVYKRDKAVVIAVHKKRLTEP